MLGRDGLAHGVHASVAYPLRLLYVGGAESARNRERVQRLDLWQLDFLSRLGDIETSLRCEW